MGMSVLQDQNTSSTIPSGSHRVWLRKSSYLKKADGLMEITGNGLQSSYAMAKPL